MGLLAVERQGTDKRQKRINKVLTVSSCSTADGTVASINKEPWHNF